MLRPINGLSHTGRTGGASHCSECMATRGTIRLLSWFRMECIGGPALRGALRTHHHDTRVIHYTTCMHHTSCTLALTSSSGNQVLFWVAYNVLKHRLAEHHPEMPEVNMPLRALPCSAPPPDLTQLSSACMALLYGRSRCISCPEHSPI